MIRKTTKSTKIFLVFFVFFVFFVVFSSSDPLDFFFSREGIRYSRRKLLFDEESICRLKSHVHKRMITHAKWQRPGGSLSRSRAVKSWSTSESSPSTHRFCRATLSISSVLHRYRSGWPGRSWSMVNLRKVNSL